MNARDPTALLPASRNDRKRGSAIFLPTATPGDRAGPGRIAGHIGIGAAAETLAAGDGLLARRDARLDEAPRMVADAAQAPTPSRVWQLARAVDDPGAAATACGLRATLGGRLSPGPATLPALAEGMRRVRTLCRCARRTTMVLRRDTAVRATTGGAQGQIGSNRTGEGQCRHHRRAATGDTPPA